jgi:uncharacterized protein YbaA (DUF1428 family)
LPAENGSRKRDKNCSPRGVTPFILLLTDAGMNNESATKDAGHLETFFYRVPKKNHDAIVKNLKQFVPWFEKNGAAIEYYQFAGSQLLEGMPMLSIDKTLSAADDEDIWVELQYYRDRKHRDDTFAKMMQDKSLEPLGNEFFGLITKGSSLVTGGFSRLAQR